MNQKILAVLLALPAFSLTACSQTPVNNTQIKQSDAQQKTAAVAQDSVPTDLAATLTKKLEATYEGQNLKVQSINTTPIAGLYEFVVTGNQIVYVDAKADYMLVGDLIDINTRKSLTEDRASELNKINYASLPLDKAIKEVRGNGTLQVVVFTDPECPFCKRLETEFAKINDITIYNFMMPIATLHPSAQQQAVQIWCQPNRTMAWTALMRTGKPVPKVAVCDNPIAETVSLGEQLGFTGTPTIIFPNGKTQSGYAPMPQLLELIRDNQK